MASPDETFRATPVVALVPKPEEGEDSPLTDQETVDLLVETILLLGALYFEARSKEDN